MTEHKEHRESEESARKEAKSIVLAMKHGVDMTDELNISEETMRILMEECETHPEEAYIIKNSLAHRERVRAYVDQILSGKATMPGPDDAEEVEDDEPAESATPEAEIEGSYVEEGYRSP